MNSHPFYRWAPAVGAIMAVVLMAATDLAASTYRAGDNVRITNLHQIDDDLYIGGNRITVDGLVDGDLCASGKDVSINGSITQTLNVFAQNATHAGTIEGSVRAFVYDLEIDGRIGRSLLVFAYDTHIGRGAVIERDANLFGFRARIDGTVGRDVEFEGAQVIITGEIGGNLSIEAEDISIEPPAVIKGDFSYTSAKEAFIDTTGGVQVLGDIKWIQPDQQVAEDEEEAGVTVRDIVFPLAKVLAAFFFGIIVVALFRRYAEVSFQELRSRLPVSFAAGILLVIVVILAIIILVISLIMIGIGLLLVSGEPALGAVILVLSMLSMPITAFASVSGGIMLYAGKIIVGFLLGYLLVRLFKRDPKLLGNWQLLIGLIALAIMFAIPYVGFLIYLLVSITGAGAVALGIHKCRPNPSSPGSRDMSQPAGS
ncbi:MAG: hypothetical protein AB1744_06345 [Candidatus Zixiibacteriota bacterium]